MSLRRFFCFVFVHYVDCNALYNDTACLLMWCVSSDKSYVFCFLEVGRQRVHLHQQIAVANNYCCFLPSLAYGTLHDEVRSKYPAATNRSCLEKYWGNYFLGIVHVEQSEFLICNKNAIPVGCVPPVHWPHLVVSVGGAGRRGGVRTRGFVCRGGHACPPLWIEWQTLVKILPCPKLRLRAVITYRRKN